ncbi:hypothetical protein F4808DRAFT_464358 [Astrocystis sublimbata]|nr:hypothetical protein F4808DRAFT_464358 [Astrocystis sublimbata]
MSTPFESCRRNHVRSKSSSSSSSRRRGRSSPEATKGGASAAVTATATATDGAATTTATRTKTKTKRSGTYAYRGTRKDMASTAALSRCGSWRDPLGTTRMTGAAASTSKSCQSAFHPPSHPPSQPRARSCRPRSWSWPESRSSWTHRAVIIFLISCWCLISTAAAAAVGAGAGAGAGVSASVGSPTLTLTEIDLDTDSASDADSDLLLIDTRIPVFVDGHWQIMSGEEHGELRRRAADPKDAPHATTTEVDIDTSTITKTNPQSSATAAASPLPSPFDGALAANFSGNNCPSFIYKFLANETFKACYPISLLLQGSQSFFEAEKSFFDITRVLDAACKADVDMCTDYFAGLASTLIADGNCGKEYAKRNALVVQAYQGMRTYETVYKATCLTNADSDMLHYCFANAITNHTTPSNAYLYYLPFNSTLPSTAAPACGSCTRQTMEIYQAATSNRKAEIANTYPSAAQQINSECGQNFVNTSLAAVVDSGAMGSLHPAPTASLLLLSFLFMIISRWVL